LSRSFAPLFPYRLSRRHPPPAVTNVMGLACVRRASAVVWLLVARPVRLTRCPPAACSSRRQRLDCRQDRVRRSGPKPLPDPARPPTISTPHTSLFHPGVGGSSTSGAVRQVGLLKPWVAPEKILPSNVWSAELAKLAQVCPPPPATLHSPNHIYRRVLMLTVSRFAD
jgi:hypothetical protein